MRKNVRLLGSFARKTGACLLSGALAAALVPAAALAADDTSSDSTTITIGDTSASGGYAAQAGENSQKLASTSYTWANTLYEEDGSGTGEESYTSIIWEDGSWTQTAAQEAAGIYVWSTYVKGDDSHYGHYSVDFTFTVDTATGELQGVDLSSSGTTFGGSWGNISKTTTIQGYLPDGVSNTTTLTENSDGSVTIALALDGTDTYGGYSVDSATLYQVNSEGGIYELDENGDIVYEQVVDEDDGDVDNVAVTLGSEDATVDDDDTVTVSDVSTSTGYGVLATTYVIGSYFKFTQYTALNAYGQKYSFEATDFFEQISGIGQKNREEYTAYAFNLIMEQELASFVENLNTGGTDDTAATVDIVSGATKSSDAIVEAVYAALGYYYPLTNKSGLSYSVTSGKSTTTYGTAAEPEPTAVSSTTKYDSDGDGTADAMGWDAIFTSVSDDLDLTLDANPSENYKGTEGSIDANDNTTVTIDEDGNYVLHNDLYADASYFGTAGVALYNYGTTTLTDLQKVNLGFEVGYVLNSQTDVEGADEYVGGIVTSNSVNHGFKGELGRVYDSDYNITSTHDVYIVGDEGAILAVYDPDEESVTVKSGDVTHVALAYVICKSSTNSGLGLNGLSYDLAELAEANLENATVTLSKTSYTYTGKALKPSVTVKSHDGTTLVEGTDYTVSYSSNTNAGTAKVTVTGAGDYTGSVTKSFTIAKASQSLKVTTKAVSAKKAKKTTAKAIKKVSGAKGAVSYKKTSGSKKITVNAKTGKVTVKKGLKAGTYKVKVKVSAKATSNYKAASKTVTIKVKVK